MNKHNFISNLNFVSWFDWKLDSNTFFLGIDPFFTHPISISRLCMLNALIRWYYSWKYALINRKYVAKMFSRCYFWQMNTSKYARNDNDILLGKQ